MQPFSLFTAVAPLAGALAPPKLSNGTWSNLPDITIGARQEHSVTALGASVYLFGGLLPNRNATTDPTTNTVQSYSTVFQKWKNETGLPLPLNHLNVATVGGKIYVSGGLTVGPGAWPNWIAVGNSWVYDALFRKWSSLSPSPPGTDRGASAVGVHKDTIYLAGGLKNLSAPAYISVNTVTAYNTKKKIWTTLPPLPTVLDHAGGAVVGDTFYVIGGRINGSIAGNVGSVYALDLKAKSPSWTRKADLPTARSGLAVAAVGSKIYTFGGEGDRTAVTTYVFDDVEVFDTKSDTWRVLPSWPVPR